MSGWSAKCGGSARSSYSFSVAEVALLLGMLVGVPVALALFLGHVQFRSVTPLAFRCRHCSHDFRQPPHHDFPASCPRCGARDWSS
jgi:hypothetical protein